MMSPGHEGLQIKTFVLPIDALTCGLAKIGILRKSKHLFPIGALTCGIHQEMISSWHYEYSSQ